MMIQPQISHRTIMLVDDNDLTNTIHQALLRNFFASDSISVHSTPDSALQWLETVRRRGGSLPDLILLDIEMPGMSGWELLKELQNRRIPVRVCMLSSSIANEDMERKNEFEEVLDYISKPLAQDHIPRLMDMVKQ